KGGNLPSLYKLRRTLQSDDYIGLFLPSVFSSGLPERRIFGRLSARVLNKENVFALERVHLGSAEDDLPSERQSSARFIFGAESRYFYRTRVPIDAVRRGTVK